jgi:hypothetical protein
MNLRLISVTAAASAAALLGLAALVAVSPAQQGGAGFTVDKANKAVIVDAEIAPRKLPELSETYPLEVFATHTKKAGAQKSHETLLIVTAKPSDVHKALEGLGLKAGKPGLKGRNKPSGSELAIFIEWEADGKRNRVAAEDAIIDLKSNKTLAQFGQCKWMFTGSEMIFPDPEKDDKAYGADFSKTLVGIFPVTNETVIQSNLEEGGTKLEASKLVPPIGTKVKLVIQAKK